MDANLHHQTFLLHEAEVTRRLELRRRAAERADRTGAAGAGSARAVSARAVSGAARGGARRWARALSPAALRRRLGAPAGERHRPA